MMKMMEEVINFDKLCTPVLTVSQVVVNSSPSPKMYVLQPPLLIINCYYHIPSLI
jgi:hypothetical protein